GDDAVFRLNGQRIVLRSAISWGFWPASGLVPTPELARAQVEDARTLGLNMLNHHRTIAAPGLLDVQDELGLLAYCEPGGYASHGGDEFCQALAREKLLRMIRRDRSHPSVVIWNLINEETAEPTEAQRRDLLDAHALDPSRVMTFTSGWSKDGDDPLKLHARPFDPELHTEGWSDNHNAPGPGVWRDEFWKGPTDFLRHSENRGEIVFWGEEGAIAAPPRLAAIAPRINAGEPGWDGADYLAWHDALQHWLDEHGWVAAGLDVDAVTRGLGSVAYDYQARAIEHVRLGDVADGYVINGWEDSKLENHSGVVDVWRDLKGDPAPLQRANAERTLVVRLRSSVGHASEWVSPTMQSPTGTVADVGLIDETGLVGPHTLVLAMRDAEGGEVWRRALPVTLEAGPYGRMLAEGLAATFEGEAGRYVLTAELREGATED
ncbi:MAG TPA: glycoside hydrolase family 2 TIM barrel-domain containing protein, partial [Planctomycetota bacterium]|nr:glycoside hydrolase family 2 TIM barrel-domain containing protein [Planctomycetota bacterium]